MPYHHVAHLRSFADGITVGTRIKRGDLLGYCGKTGTVSPHCHYEVTREKPKSWVGYVWGMTWEQIQKVYLDPMTYATDVLPMKWTGFGYKFGSIITRNVGGKLEKSNHPGADLNWGSGDDDLGLPVRATTDGVIEYMGKNPTDGSWGNHLWWEEAKELEIPYPNHILQETEVGGKFALAYGGQKYLITPERAGLAALTAIGRKMEYVSLKKSQFDAIPTGGNF